MGMRGSSGWHSILMKLVYVYIFGINDWPGPTSKLLFIFYNWYEI